MTREDARRHVPRPGPRPARSPRAPVAGQIRGWWWRSWLPSQLSRLVTPARQGTLAEFDRARHARLGGRAVGDVFPGERLLVHPGVHVTGVDDVDPQGRVLDGEDSGQ